MRYLLLGLFVGFEAANFTGFSWTRFRWVSNEDLINAAIQYNYPDVYSNLTELQVDYSSFSPEVYYWRDLTGESGNQILNKFLGLKHFQVRLPDAAVIVASNGIVRFSRSCSAWCTPTVAPDRPVLGIVGIVQDGPPLYKAAKQFAVQWVDGSEGSVVISGHCFAAFSQSPKPALRISAPGDTEKDSLVIHDQYGYRLINIPDIKFAGYGTTMVPEREFTQLRACDKSVKALTSGGEWWREKFNGISD